MVSLVTIAILIPLVGAFFISRLDSKPNLREAVTLTTAAILFATNVLIYFSMDTVKKVQIAEPIPGLSVVFSVEQYGLLFALIASFLWIVTSIYAIGYMRGHKEHNQTRFFTLFAVALSAVMAIAYSDNLFTLFLFYEVLTVSTYPLVTHAGNENARKGGRRYLTILMGSSILFFLPAIIITWISADTLTFTQGGILAGNLNPQWAVPLLLLFLLGIGKAGMMPIHKWLPSAMVAPTPVSALLHAVAVVKAGVFSVLKIVMMIFGPEWLTETGANLWLIWLPLITIVLASFIAMTKDNLKERLAYSTIGQLSYILLGALLANESGLLGANMHIAMHAVSKITLFFAAGAIMVVTHKKQVSDLDGLGRQMPLTFAFFTVGSLSIIGLPIFGGMWSKWFLVTGAAQLEGSTFTEWAVIGGLMLSSLLNIAYLLSIPMAAFFKKGPESSGEAIQIKEAPLPCLIGMAVPVALCIYFFFDPNFIYALASYSGVAP